MAKAVATLFGGPWFWVFVLMSMKKVCIFKCFDAVTSAFKSGRGDAETVV
jgi:hypothetical protein